MSVKLTTEQFVEKSRKVHGDKYVYSKVNYINNATKVCIICPIHGEFWQRPAKHLLGQGCQICGGTKKSTTEDFIKRAKVIHCDKYDYSKVEYTTMHEKVCIICPKHGEFWQEANSHLQGKGCEKCSYEERAKNNSLGLEKFVKKARQIHNNKYDYSKVEYTNNSTKVCIICPIHGEFWQIPKDHLKGEGCSKCNGGVIHTIEQFIAKAREAHGNKYDYSKVKYVNANTKVVIICKEHGEFLMTPDNHTHGHGCPKCANNVKKNTILFINDAIKIHGDKYDYSKVDYLNNHTKVKIICPKHGEFWQTPVNHLRGNGCDICKESRLEKRIRVFLTEQNIGYEQQKRFDWLGLQSLDFYLPQYNIAIECQGKQHFGLGGWTNDEEKRQREFELTQDRDKRKKELCEEHGVKLLYFLDKKYNEFVENKDLIVNEINEIIKFLQ